MTKAERQQVYQQELAILSEKMDKQQAYFDELWAFADKHGGDNIPPEHQAAWLKCRINGRTPWRKRRAVVKRVEASARKMAKNKIKRAES